MNGVRVRFLNRNEILSRLTARAQELLLLRTDVLEVRLFGSLAKGNHAPGSDADILIVLRDDSRRFTDRIPEFLDHFSGVGLTVDIFPYTVDELNQMKENPFIKSIQKEGMVLSLSSG
jgi:predicted nucleotidyltransferase